MEGRPRGRRQRWRRNLVELLFRLRTEADTPALQACSYGIGALIGCLPIYGLHLPLCVAVGTALRLNRLRMYLAANLNNPVTGPFLVFAELQVGAWVLRGRPYPVSVSSLADGSIGRFAVDIVVGSLLVGATLGVLLGVVVFLGLRADLRDAARHALLETAAARYLAAGYLQWEVVRARVLWDPLPLDLLRGGELPEHGRLLHLACGRGSLLALVDTAQHLMDGGAVADGAPGAPPGLLLEGIEPRSRPAAVARMVLGDRVRIRCADPGRAELPEAAVVVLDGLLRVLGGGDGAELLQRARAALAPGGVLVVREAEPRVGLRFVALVVAERFRRFRAGGLRGRPVYLPAARWQGLLEAAGFTVRPVPQSSPGLGADVLLLARPTPETSPRGGGG
jgi:uncharacterized protein (DUF2062 family)